MNARAHVTTFFKFKFSIKREMCVLLQIKMFLQEKIW